MLIEEIANANLENNTDFSVSKSIHLQIPYFACYNIFIDANIQKDIKRYLYCKELNVSPYSGSFGKQPYIWVDRFFTLKDAFAKLQQTQIDRVKAEQKIKGK